MGTVGETCHALTPFGVGATLAQLHYGGFPTDKKPKRPQPVHGLGLTNTFSRPPTGGSRAVSPGPRPLSHSISAPSLRAGSVRSDSSRPYSSLANTTLHWAPQDPGHWEWDHLRLARTPVRDREVGRMAKILDQSMLHNVPNATPLGVTQNAYYRRRGMVHGDPGWQN
eukprot:CAMPEP_0197659848 /NCGR_PEP_ID=MMETSP1338-20131121/49377_1 /TAXON_ID=43686 ORGANISM="Pelagodinium beii, Strain RCC1491" /NCGR_SAMPLE_ID=MMETSP1338 /ASSEMBLY_ACC=CAM_ASM_000754 /LENGTH=167 /DNA_ID=CAMNT_0043236975 /DNA_START=59 /DNA_END=562 /DNA_ORIENTATION=-